MSFFIPQRPFFLLWLAFLFFVPKPSLAQEIPSFLFLGWKVGTMDNDTEDVISSYFEPRFGELQTRRRAHVRGIELETVHFPRKDAGIGLHVEYLKHKGQLHFQSGEIAELRGHGMLYSLKLYLRWEGFLPYFGLGSGLLHGIFKGDGTYHRENVINLFTYRTGFRWLAWERWNLQFEFGRIQNAKIDLRILPGSHTFDFGGPYQAMTLGYYF